MRNFIINNRKVQHRWKNSTLIPGGAYWCLFHDQNGYQGVKTNANGMPLTRIGFFLGVTTKNELLFLPATKEKSTRGKYVGDLLYDLDVDPNYSDIHNILTQNNKSKSGEISKLSAEFIQKIKPVEIIRECSVKDQKNVYNHLIMDSSNFDNLVDHINKERDAIINFHLNDWNEPAENEAVNEQANKGVLDPQGEALKIKQLQAAETLKMVDPFTFKNIASNGVIIQTELDKAKHLLTEYPNTDRSQLFYENSQPALIKLDRFKEPMYLKSMQEWVDSRIKEAKLDESQLEFNKLTLVGYDEENKLLLFNGIWEKTRRTHNLEIGFTSNLGKDAEEQSSDIEVSKALNANGMIMCKENSDNSVNVSTLNKAIKCLYVNVGRSIEIDHGRDDKQAELYDK